MVTLIYIIILYSDCYWRYSLGDLRYCKANGNPDTYFCNQANKIYNDAKTIAFDTGLFEVFIESSKTFVAGYHLEIKIEPDCTTFTFYDFIHQGKFEVYEIHN